MQLPCVIEMAANAFFHKASIAMAGYALLTSGNANLLMAHGTPAQREVFAQERVQRALVRHHVPERAAGRLVIERRGHARRARRRGFRSRPAGPALPPARQQDVDLGRRARTHREHRAPGAGEDRRCRRPYRAGHQGHLAVHRAQADGRRRRQADRRAQRRRAGRAEPQAAATAAPPTRCSTSAKAGSRPRGARAPSAGASARPAKGCAACST